jgi:hypothetical protein
VISRQQAAIKKSASPIQGRERIALAVPPRFPTKSIGHLFGDDHRCVMNNG